MSPGISKRGPRNIRDVDPDSFGAQLRAFRMDAGLSQEELGELFGTDQARTVSVRRTVTSDKHGHGVIGSHPKTAASRRTLKLMPQTVEFLKRYQTAQKARRLRCGPLWADRGLVFDAGDGTLMTRMTAHFRFVSTVKRLGFRPLTLHGLRHTMAVTWLRAGKSPKVVSERLGHASVAFTLDIYAHVSPEWQERDAEDVQTFIEQTG